MSTTNVQPLPHVRGRMSYTELGRGERRRGHIAAGTDRIAAQMGDAASREAFTEYCEGLRSVHPNAVNEGYELRVSWALDELDPNKPEDIQRGMEYAYTLCHELAPDSPCWVTMHVDGEGGCVHAHTVIANHDARTGQVVNKGDTSLYAPRVQAVNDRLSREYGFQVLGADRQRSTWAERRETFKPTSFDRDLGDKVARARDSADTLEGFKANLDAAGITLNESAKTDKKTGETTHGWSYRMLDTYGPKRRTRKRRASNLADDLTKDGIEAYFAEKQAEREAKQQAQQQATPVAVPEAVEPVAEPEETQQLPEQPDVQQPVTDEHEHVHDEPEADPCDLDEDDVAGMADDLTRAHVKRCREDGRPIIDDRYRAIAQAHDDPAGELETLRGEVDAARRAFRDSKAEADALRRGGSVYAAAMVFRSVCNRAKDPVARMMADMMVMMMAARMEEQRRREREEAEARLYESRSDMWDAEKRLRAAEKALGHEDEREARERAQKRARRAEARFDDVAARAQREHDEQLGG